MLALGQPAPLLSLPQLGLIQLDQDDTNNWLKLGTVCRPNDPYLNPSFVATASSFFPRRTPFGAVYLGSVARVSARIPPLDATSALTS